MFHFLRNLMYVSVERDPVFKVKYNGRKVKLILTDHYMILGKDSIIYTDILWFGFNNKIFNFTIKNKQSNIKIFIVTKKSKAVYLSLYKKCHELAEIVNPLINIEYLPDPPTEPAYDEYCEDSVSTL